MMSSINDKLPNEMLAKVFGHLDSESSARACRAVCSRWNKVVDETVGISCAIGSSVEIVTHNEITGEEIVCPQIPLEGISTLGVKFCSVGLIDDSNYGANLHFGYPTCLKGLQFLGPLPQENFESLVLPLTSLTEFSIHYSSLENIDLRNSDTWLNNKFEFPVLKVFSICSKRFTPQADLTGLKLALENACHLLNSVKSRCLEKLFIHIPHYKPYELKTVETILICIDRHWKTLRSLDMFFCISIVANTEHHDDNLDPLDEGFIFDWSKFRGVFFNRICLACGKSMNTYESWKKLIKIQHNLEEIYWMNEEVKRDITGTSIVSSNLRKVLFQLNTIDTRPSINPDFNCAVFAKCSNLTHLLVRGRTGYNLQAGQKFRAIVSNGHRLPASLKVLSFREVYLPTNVISMIIKQCVNMRKFRLIDIGHTGHWGFGPQDFNEILLALKYEEIEISHGFNRSAFRAYERSDIYQDAMIWKILHTGRFHAVKTEDDLIEDEEYFYYAFKDGSMFEYPSIPALRPHGVCDVVFQ